MALEIVFTVLKNGDCPVRNENLPEGIQKKEVSINGGTPKSSILGRLFHLNKPSSDKGVPP